ncbi:MAG: DUF4878 domain-containing protein, partial [Candidatus Altiarchaeota archaeon]|nr:DUF4878 domain-containing protein [Candidatus Altiarchaeota archaeon]
MQLPIMERKSLIILGLVIVSILLFSGCTTKTGEEVTTTVTETIEKQVTTITETSLDTPSGIYMAHIAALQKGDLEESKKYAAKESILKIEKMEEDRQAYDKSIKLLVLLTPRDVKILNEEIEGEQATLTVSGTMMGKEATGTVKLVKENGDWKVTEGGEWKVGGGQTTETTTVSTGGYDKYDYSNVVCKSEIGAHEISNDIFGGGWSFIERTRGSPHFDDTFEEWLSWRYMNDDSYILSLKVIYFENGEKAKDYFNRRLKKGSGISSLCDGAVVWEGGAFSGSSRKTFKDPI